ncbi:hypothetical protein SCUCBS95973_009624 [Sporothrix curviconia]|uniref:Spindle pole body-associated protein cut12 domain-containing protein n=1 Tax=Sporothrix curviconia TaxID=1260050 RepID=A0ABP0CY65_9PEZI
MLGWVIKRGLDGGRDASEDPDDTRIEQPDTPGPVFAARAFKSALFGTPARPDDTVDNIANQPAAAPLLASQEPPVSAAAKPAPAARETNTDTGAPGATPRRLPGGILLTPGTATSRRKRVSFGSEVVPGEGHEKRSSEFRIDRNGRRPNLFGDATRKDSSRATLAKALDNARRQGSKKSQPTTAAKPAIEQVPQTDRWDTLNGEVEVEGAEGDDWEEVDDDDGRDPDITVDLNEPHSQSGRYWKSEFQRYQEDAKVEMGKLLKYKQLAKSYAKMKDAEAADMQTKLKEEKENVAQMEGRITELAGQIARKRMDGSDRDYQELISDLTRQTARAVQYRTQVKELEAMLQNSEKAAASAAPALSAVASPRTQKTILETQRELRRARDQLRELTQAKDEVRRLKSALRAAEQRASAKDEGRAEGSKGLATSLAAAEARAATLSAKVEDLEKRLLVADEERRQKDKDLRLLQRKYDSLKDDAKARVGEAEQVMRRKNEEIAELKKQVRQATVAAATAAAAATTTTTASAATARKTAAATNDFEIAKDDDTAEPVVADSASAKLALLRRRRGAEPLRPAVDPPQSKNVLSESVGANRGHVDMARPKMDSLPALRTRPALTAASSKVAATAAAAKLTGAEQGQKDPVAAAVAAAADASRLSISSERAAAAVARIEMRRAQRKRDLELMRNKENMQPA